MYKVTFTFKGYIAAVIYNECKTEAAAIESAKLHVVTTWDKVRAELV